VSKDGSSYSVLHDFGSYEGDGIGAGTLLASNDGLLYGATDGGGNAGGGGGTVFKLRMDGSGFSVLYSFGSMWHDGSIPSGLLLGSDSVLYGTTSGGGLYGNQYSDGPGTVFRLNTDGSGYTILHNFGSGSDGRNPRGLIEASDGALYGTTDLGGLNGWGTVFKLNKDGSGYAILHNFGNGSDGSAPLGLVEGRGGALFGAADGGGFGRGTVFRLNKDGSRYEVLYSFGATGTDGQGPRAGLIQGSNGAFYGTTSDGGDFGFGTVFRIWPPETPDAISLTTTGGTSQVVFSGAAGELYQILRSADLINWTVLTTIVMPASGSYAFTDGLAPSPAAYYRTAWVPKSAFKRTASSGISSGKDTSEQAVTEGPVPRTEIQLRCTTHKPTDV
jgi:uncharacterized repeat protein (TIGR03803 family)